MIARVAVLSLIAATSVFSESSVFHRNGLRHHRRAEQQYFVGEADEARLCVGVREEQRVLVRECGGRAGKPRAV